MENINENNAYDLVTYNSFPYPHTEPEHLYTIAHLFDVGAVDPRKAKILELGCASGGNIIPMAIKYPNSEFVGIDLSSVQVDEGNKQINALKLKNISLKNISITDIDKDFGEFDYIIVHGVLSWVPKDVQDKIFEICSKNLSKKGIAYISYNTLPGWSVVRGIREMMLYHTDKFDNPSDKSVEARRLLNFIKQGNKNSDKSPYSQIIQNEIDMLSNCEDSYLLHDHLEENNQPFYFHEFMEVADKNGLKYVGDTSISTMFAGNMTKEVSDVLSQISNDIVRTEQYMDFVRNRRFRSTLLCHKDVAVKRNIAPVKMKDFYIKSNLIAQDSNKEINAISSDCVIYKLKSGADLTVKGKNLIVALNYLLEIKTPIHVKDLIQEVKKRIGNIVSEDKFEKSILNELMRIVFLNGTTISSFSANYVTNIANKPKISDLVRHQALSNNWITNQRSEKVSIDIFNRVLSRYLDGDNDFETIVTKMTEHVSKGELVLNDNGKAITDEKLIKEKTTQITQKSLEMFCSCAILVA